MAQVEADDEVDDNAVPAIEPIQTKTKTKAITATDAANTNHTKIKDHNSGRIGALEIKHNKSKIRNRIHNHDVEQVEDTGHQTNNRNEMQVEVLENKAHDVEEDHQTRNSARVRIGTETENQQIFTRLPRLTSSLTFRRTVNIQRIKPLKTLTSATNPNPTTTKRATRTMVSQTPKIQRPNRPQTIQFLH